jgi:hypothetical protein
MELLLIIVVVSVATGIRSAGRDHLPATWVVFGLLFVAAMGYLSLRII